MHHAYGPGVVIVHHYGYGAPSVVHVYHPGGYGYGGYGSGSTVTHVYHNGYGGVSHVVVHHYR